jgi:SAM-dependent methyltransferase
MFSQKIAPLIESAVKELERFVPTSIVNYNRDTLIERYWQFHPRFKSFKIFPKQGANVLDIGSGSGGLFFWKESLEPKRNDLRMTALDLQKGQYFDKYNDYVLVNLDIAELPFRPESYDYIFLSHLIEHVKDWKLLMRKCNRVLKSGGIMYIETPSKHTVDLPSRDFYKRKGFPCTTINFLDDHTHTATVDIDEVNTFVNDEFDIIAVEKGYCTSPLLENTLLSFGYQSQDLELTQYGLWSKLMFSSYGIFQKL